MAKKSQTNARRNNTQAGRRVVNFYNSTINIDARQNRSSTNKTENKGCTINYPCYPSANLFRDYFMPPDQSQSATDTRIVNTPTPKQKEDRKPFSRNIVIAASIATTAIVAGLTFAAIKYFN